jgi:Kef-type K+ transport system membrane component KefB
MDTTLIIGIILFSGFVLGELAQRIMLPRVTGYIIAGILLNPQIAWFMPKNIASHTTFVTNFALSFITFSIGGSLILAKIRKLGRSILSITFFEAEVTFLVVALAVAFSLPHLAHKAHGDFMHMFLPLGLIIGALASPTDPTGTLAVKHQFKSEGDVTSTILSVSAFDDALGLMNFSIAAVIAQVLVLHESFSLANSLGKPLLQVGGAFVVGTVFGFIFNFIGKIIRKDTEGVLIVMLFSLLGLCYGLAHLADFDELLATMTMGIIVTNFNKNRDRVFEILERYTEEMIFVLFFTLSGMYLNFGILATTGIGVALYAISRTVGKFSGTYVGGVVGHSSSLVKHYTAFGLIPSGGIIVGLALLLKQNPAFNAFADVVINVIIGATVIHELVGPILVQIAFKKSGEVGRAR